MLRGCQRGGRKGGGLNIFQGQKLPPRILSRRLSGPLDRLNAILSLRHPLDRYRTPSAIGSAIGRALSLALSRIQTQVGVLNHLVLNRA